MLGHLVEHDRDPGVRLVPHLERFDRIDQPDRSELADPVGQYLAEQPIALDCGNDREQPAQPRRQDVPYLMLEQMTGAVAVGAEKLVRPKPAVDFLGEPQHSADQPTERLFLAVDILLAPHPFGERLDRRRAAPDVSVASKAKEMLRSAESRDFQVPSGRSRESK